MNGESRTTSETNDQESAGFDPEFFAWISAGDIDVVSARLLANPGLANQLDDSGAIPLHLAVLRGHREIVRLLIADDAQVNSRDGKCGAAPAGWAIEYLRELGALLAIEIDDFEHAITRGDVHRVERFLDRFPHSKQQGRRARQDAA